MNLESQISLMNMVGKEYWWTLDMHAKTETYQEQSEIAWLDKKRKERLEQKNKWNLRLRKNQNHNSYKYEHWLGVPCEGPAKKSIWKHDHLKIKVFGKCSRLIFRVITTTDHQSWQYTSQWFQTASHFSYLPIASTLWQKTTTLAFLQMWNILIHCFLIGCSM